MSIEPLASAASGGPAPVAAALVVLVLVLFVLALALAGRLISHRQPSVLRVPLDRPAWPLAVVLFGALAVYLLVASLIFSVFRGPAGASQAATTHPAAPSLALTAFLATFPPLAGFLALLLGDAVARDLTGHDLGLDLRRMPMGILGGMLGVVIVVPPLFILSSVLEAFYRAIQYAHPAEHPLLKALGEQPAPWQMAMIVTGATLVAPFFEELLFRGHVQTLLVRLFVLIGGPAEPRAAFPVVPAPADAGSPPLPEFATPMKLPGRPRAWQTWAAIVITSAIFASVHPLWTSPIIFVLALCLGYAYERTGNLWVSITIHAAFNSISTALFLLTFGAH